MGPDSWRWAKGLIAATLDLPEQDRGGFLVEHCPDVQIRTEIESLLTRAGGAARTKAPTRDVSAAPEHGAGPTALWDSALPARFRPLGRLGSGTFGDVYRIFDEESQSRLALKVLRRVTASGLYHFKQEFRNLTAFRHPNVVRLYELLFARGTWMFTMELVDGLPFDRYISRSPARDAALRQALSQLSDGVAALHAGGFLHRDLKPSNVLVTADGRVVVVDFGLVRELHPLESQDTLSIVGTPAYMAPEQFSLEAMTESSDWYAVGVMLYEALTGRLPFEGSLLELFAQKQSSDVIPPSQLLGEVPPDLEEICLGLLQRDPRRRLSGADLRRRLDAPGGAPRTPEPQAHIPPVSGVEFVGRTRELAAAHDAFVNTRSGQPQLVHVSGVSGIGKTAFIRQLIDGIKNVSPDVVILPGRCHPTESVPYQGIDQVIDGLARHLRRIGRNEAEKVLPRDFAMLVKLFPVLEPLNASAPARMRDVADPTEFRNRVFLALREMLGRLAERHPVVIVIDDLQWADLDALAVLRELAAPPAAPALLLVLAYRSEDAASASPLRQFVELTTSGNGYPEPHLITLKGLDDWDATRLVEALARVATPLDRDLVSAVVAESAGSPFFAQELVQGLAQAGAAAFGSPGTLSMERAVALRLDALSDDERGYLELVSVAGRPTRVSVVDTAAAVRSSRLLRDDLVGKRLLRTVGVQGGDTVEIYHDRIREVIVSSLSDERTRACHAQLATALGRAGNEDPELLAFHQEHAGDVSGAIANALAAARHATVALAFGKAARCYQQVLSLGLHDRDERCLVMTELGDALSNAGLGREAADAYMGAADLSAGEARFELRSRAASQYLRGGHLREGVHLFEAVLQEVGLRVPERRWSLLLRIAIERIRLLASRRRAAGTRSGIRSPRDYVETDACAAAAVGFSMVDPLRSEFFSTRFVRLASRLGEPRRLCLALAGEATQLCHTPGGAASDRVAQLLAQAGELAERIDDAHARAFVMTMSGTVAYLQGNWRRAWERTDAAIEMLQSTCTGVAWELCTAHTIGFVARCARGEWAESARRLPALVREAEARDDRYAQHSLRVLGCAYVLDLAADDPDKARRELDQDLSAWSYEHFDIQRANASLAKVDIALYEGRPERAVAVIRSEWGLIVRSKLLRIPTTFVFSWTARARATLALACLPGVEPRLREALLHEASEASRRLLRAGPPWGHGLGTLFLAGVASCQGNRGRATQLLVEAEASLLTAELIPYVMAARWRVALSKGNREAIGMDASVNDWTSKQNIRRPERVLGTLAPGRWD